MSSVRAERGRRCEYESEDLPMKTTTRASMLLGLTSAALLTSSMFVALPAQLGAARSGSEAAAKLDAELAGLGLPELARAGGTHYSDTDLTPGSDRRWAFPALQAAQLEPGETLAFVRPGGTAVEIPLLERTLIDERTIHFTFTDAAAGNAAQITVHAGLVRGLVHANIGGRHHAWSLASGTDANGLSGDYYADAAGDAGDAGTDEVTAPAPIDASATADAAWTFDGGEESPHAEETATDAGTGCSLHAPSASKAPWGGVLAGVGALVLRRRRRTSRCDGHAQPRTSDSFE